MLGRLHSFLNEKMLRDSVLYGLTTLVAGAFGYLFHFVISRKLSVAGYGEFQSLNSLSLVFGAGTAALNYFFLKFFPVFAKARDYKAHRQFAAWAVRKMWLVFVAFVAVFLVLIPFFQSALHIGTPWGLILVMIAVSLGIMGSLYGGALMGWEYFFAAGSIGVVGAVVKLVFGYLIAARAPAATFVFASVVVGAAASLACAYFINRRRFFVGEETEKETAPSSWRERYYASFNIRKHTYAILAFSFLLALLGNVDVLLVKNLTSPELTGFYGALRTLGAVILTLNLAIGSVVLPAACAEGHDRKSLNLKIILFAYVGMFLISAGGTLLFALFPRFVVGMLFGPQYLSVAGSLWLFGPLSLFLSFLIFESNLAYARHDYRVSWALLLTLTLTVSAVYGAVYQFHAGIAGIAIAVTASFAVGYGVVLIMNTFSRKKAVLEPLLPLETLQGI